MNYSQKVDIIKGLQFIRLFAFFLIFLSHAINSLSIIGAAGVSLFIVLSGFLMTYNYLKKDILINPFLFAIRKLKRLYPLHILMMIVMIVRILFRSFPGFFDLIISIVSNIFLVQAWIPKQKYYYSLNSVSWYLCLCLLFYLVFPFVIKMLRKIENNKILFSCFALVFLFELGLSLFSSIFGSKETTDLFSIHWITYIFPISRLLDFLLGCILGVLVIRRGRKHSKYSKLLGAVSLIVFLSICLLIFLKVPFFCQESIKYSLLFLPISVFIIFSFSGCEFLFERFLSNKVIFFLSELTPYAFLIHALIIYYCKKLLSVIDINNHIFSLILIIFSFVLTMVLSWGYKRIMTIANAKLN